MTAPAGTAARAPRPPSCSRRSPSRSWPPRHRSAAACSAAGVAVHRPGPPLWAGASRGWGTPGVPLYRADSVTRCPACTSGHRLWTRTADGDGGTPTRACSPRAVTLRLPLSRSRTRRHGPAAAAAHRGVAAGAVPQPRQGPRGGGGAPRAPAPGRGPPRRRRPCSIGSRTGRHARPRAAGPRGGRRRRGGGRAVRARAGRPAPGRAARRHGPAGRAAAVAQGEPQPGRALGRGAAHPAQAGVCGAGPAPPARPPAAAASAR